MGGLIGERQRLAVRAVWARGRFLAETTARAMSISQREAIVSRVPSGPSAPLEADSPVAHQPPLT